MKQTGGSQRAGRSNFRNRLHEVIFEADTAAGKNFDLALLAMIIPTAGRRSG